MKRLETPQSSNIAALEYNSQESYLVVEFKRGDRYGYKRVPRELATKLNIVAKAGGSVGVAFNIYVKGKYECQKLSTVNQ